MSFVAWETHGPPARVDARLKCVR